MFNHPGNGSAGHKDGQGHSAQFFYPTDVAVAPRAQEAPPTLLEGDAPSASLDHRKAWDAPPHPTAPRRPPGG